MLLPILTSTRIQRFPFVVVGLAVVNAVIFLMTREDLSAYAWRWGYVPASSATAVMSQLIEPAALQTMVTHAFFHAGWWHLIGNLWALAVFGIALESKKGPVWFAMMYFVLALTAALVHGLLQAGPPRPAIGASGAISGLMGCYLALEPRSRILSFCFLGVVSFFTEIPALFYAAVWLVLQIDGIHTRLLTGPECRNVAWWAHLGGFLTGMCLGIVLARRGLSRAA